MSVQGTAYTSCAATADAVRGEGLVRWTVWAIIKSRQSRPEGGFGRWRLTPPRYWGCRLRAGRRSFTPLRGYTSSASCGGTFSCAHPSVYPKGTCFAARTGAPSRGRLFYACGREHLIRRCAPPSPQGEGFGWCAIQHRTPQGEGYRGCAARGKGLGGAAVGEKNTYRGWGKRSRKPPRR